MPSHDRLTYAQPNDVRITHLHLDLALDFDAHVLDGTATYDLDWSNPAAGALVLDSHNLQVVEAAVFDRQRWQPSAFDFGTPDVHLGARLTIATPTQPSRVRVRYQTSPGATGLQWLDARQTAGGRLPFMFSQSQAIHARSWVPVQDTPSIRFTYAATVECRSDVMVLMSADNGEHPARTGHYRVEMPQPIPSYLLAIAAGDLVFASTSDRCGVWAEPEVVDAAAAEFADTETMMVVAERQFGPYRWGRYDVLVLPPSFPHGGMENPRMTFATPTVIVGDKSLTSLVAHELAHSWSGNLVTQDSWDDIWLNEGFTSYVENRIVEAVYGTELAQMETVIKQASILAVVADADPATVAVELPPLNHHGEYHGGFGLGYLKGCWFLHWLESRYGRERFDAFIASYFDQFAFHSICTDDFVAFATEHLTGRYPGAVSDAEFAAWLDEPGMPAFAERAESVGFGVVDVARDRWLRTGQLPEQAATAAWMTQEWLRFLDGMPPTCSSDQLAELDAAYQFTGTPNGEIARRWYALGASADYAPARVATATFLTKVGRMKLIMPVYQALIASPAGLDFARSVFDQARPGYHPITVSRVEAAFAAGR